MSIQNIIVLVVVSGIHVAMGVFAAGLSAPENKPLLVLQGVVLPPPNKSETRKKPRVKKQLARAEIPVETKPQLSQETDTGQESVKPPRSDASHLNNPLPRYPKLSKRLREEGVVILEVLILEDGRVDEVRIKKSSGYKRLDKAALTAVKKWRYVPARSEGRAVAYRYQQPVEFYLKRGQVL